MGAATERRGPEARPAELGEEKYQIVPGGIGGPTSQTDEGPLTAILFVEVRDIAEAVKIAEPHPALPYDVISVEVHEWTSPPAPPPHSRPLLRLD